MVKEVKVQKNGIVKQIEEHQVAQYVANGWQVVKGNPNIFANNNNQNYNK